MHAFSYVLLLFHSISWSVPERCCNLVWLTALCKYGWKTHSDLFFKAVFYYDLVAFLSTHFLYLRCSCTFFFSLKWQCATQRIKTESILIPFFLFTPLHLVIFFTAFRRHICFIFVKIHSGAKWIMMQSTFSSKTVLWSCRCHFSVCLRQIVNRLSNPTQNVPSCGFYC